MVYETNTNTFEDDYGEEDSISEEDVELVGEEESGDEESEDDEEEEESEEEGNEDDEDDEVDEVDESEEEESSEDGSQAEDLEAGAYDKETPRDYDHSTREESSEYDDDGQGDEEMYADEPYGDEEGKERGYESEYKRPTTLVLSLCCCCWFILAVVFFALLMANGGDEKNTTTEGLAAVTPGGPPRSPASPASPGSSPAGSPTASPEVVNITEAPTASPSVSPTEDPNKTFFPATADTYVTDEEEFADLAFGTSEILQVLTTANASSVILLKFNLTELPPEIDSVLVESLLFLRLVHAGEVLSNPSPSITVSRLGLLEDLDIESLTWNAINSSLTEGMVEGSTFTLTNETDVFDVEITDLILSELNGRRHGRLLQQGTVVLALQTNDESNPLGESFQSRESGEIVAPKIYHEYRNVKITSCDQQPCGSLASCWELEKGGVMCECGNGEEVDFDVPCGIDTVTCLPGQVLDAEEGICVCPPEAPIEDARGRCFAEGSKCLVTGTPCRGVASACYEDANNANGFVCRCPDDSVVSENDDCPDSTINSCFEPFNPCGNLAICHEREDARGDVSDVYCECVGAPGTNGTAVPFGVECLSV